MSNDCGYTPEAEPAACWFIGGFTALLGSGLLITGIDKLQHDPAWMLPQILFAAVVVFMGWRVTQYHKRVVFVLGRDAIERRPFWSLPKRYRYSEIQAVGFYEQDNIAKDYTKRVTGQATGQIVTSQHLVLKMKSGKVHTIVLPRFDNTAMMQELQRRTGLRYEAMPRQAAG